MKMIHMQLPDFPAANLEGYILDCELTLGQEKSRPAIVVCPGGGYVFCSDREAEPVALRYAAAGFHAFILRYSTGKSFGDFNPLKEISWVIGYLRQNAQQWNIDPDKILVCGFSAGGHLALASGVAGEHKPNGMILCYPAVDVFSDPASVPLVKLLMGKEELTAEEMELMDLLNKVDENAPPVFMVATAEDMLTSRGALPLAAKYSQLGLAYELHIFQHGPHGYSLGDETSADGSSRMLNEAYANWLPLSVTWLKKVYGQPQFTDTSTSIIAKRMQELWGDSVTGDMPRI